MSAYVIARIQADDPSALRPYQAATPAVIARYRGKFVVRGGTTTTYEGPEESRRVVVIEFPDIAMAKAFCESPEYAEARKLRDGVATVELIAVEGVG